MSGMAEFNAAQCGYRARTRGADSDCCASCARPPAPTGDPAVVGEILDRLIDYSEAHFVSEELLMR
jgi:hypothetical protein